MNMKSLCVTVAAALLLGVAGSATAASSIYAASTGPESLNQFTPHVLPVLVKVDDQGKVTEVSPAYKLRPKFRRLLRKTLDEMITAPAHQDGHAIASQFVINMVTKATPRDDGKYDFGFTYVSTQPVPSGSWYWNHIDGHRLALVRQGAFQNQWRSHRIRHHRHYRPRVVHPYAPSRATPSTHARHHESVRPSRHH